MPARTQGEENRLVDDIQWAARITTATQFSTQPPLYHDRYEHDACGIGFVAQTDGRRSNEVLRLAVTAWRAARATESARQMWQTARAPTQPARVTRW